MLLKNKYEYTNNINYTERINARDYIFEIHYLENIF